MSFKQRITRAPTNTTRSSGKNRERGAKIKEEILQEEKQLEEYVLLHTASSSFF